MASSCREYFAISMDLAAAGVKMHSLRSDAGYDGPRSALERKVCQHEERVGLMTFLREHLINGEV